MIDSENDKNILFHFFERFYDSDDSFSNYEHQYQLLISQSTVSLEKVIWLSDFLKKLIVLNYRKIKRKKTLKKKKKKGNIL